MEEGDYRRAHHARLIGVRILLLLAALVFVLGTPCVAAGYPSRPIHLILPYAPGGIIEFVGRTLAQKFGDVLHEPVVVEERSGAGGILGVNYTAHAAPDGYTIVLVDPAIVTNPSLHKSLPYDIFKDLVPVSIVATAPECSSRRRSLASRPRRRWSRTARPIPASSITRRPASAARPTWQPRCGRPAPASKPPTSRIVASVPPSSI